MWEPPGIHASAISTADVVAALRLGEAEVGAQSIETLHVVTADGAFDAVARVRDASYKIDVTLGSATYEFGRVDGTSWRRTPNGSVRTIRSDVQGDMLDRWPRAVFGFDPTGCTANGTMDYGGSTRDVLDCRVAGDFEHWFLVDPRTGRIVREISREGSRVVFYDFGDFHTIDGRALPFHWRISGADGDGDVTISDLRSARVSAEDVAIPATVSDQFQLPSSGTAEIPATFKFHIEVPVQVNGQTRTFIVDTGTSQTIVDIGEANRLGLHPQFGHARVAELRVGDVVAKNLAVEAIDVFHDNYNAGILGNEFFTGHIVHINYPAKKLELLSHAAFKPPPDAFPLKINVAEGIPIVAAVMNGVQGDRFALDSGSYFVLVRANFGDEANLSGYPNYGRRGSFLEGPFDVQPTLIKSFGIGKYQFGATDGMIEVPNRDNTDFPLDGILGTELLGAFDLWFDYDNGVVWMR